MSVTVFFYIQYCTLVHRIRPEKGNSKAYKSALKDFLQFSRFFCCRSCPRNGPLLYSMVIGCVSLAVCSHWLSYLPVRSHCSSRRNLHANSFHCCLGVRGNYVVVLSSCMYCIIGNVQGCFCDDGLTAVNLFLALSRR